MRKDEDELTTAWTAFIAEASALAAADPETMPAESLERLEALSDPFIHVVGHRESLERRETHASPAFAELGLRDEVLSAGRSSRRGRMQDRARRLLRERILCGLHAQRLRVGMPRGAPATLPVGRVVPIGSALLADAERAHQAVVVPELAIAAGLGHELWETDCDTLIELSPEVPRGQYLALKVAGDSMEPMLHSGDVVLVKLGGDPTVGRVVVARDPDHGYVVKEVGRVTMDEIELRSLNPGFGPIVVPPVTGAILGTVLLRWCSHTQT